METGRFGASVGEVARLLDHYGVYEELRAELLSRVVPGPSAPEVRLAGKDRSRAVESRLTTLT